MIEVILHQKQEIRKKTEEKRTFLIFYFKFHICFPVTAQFLMLKIKHILNFTYVNNLIRFLLINVIFFFETLVPHAGEHLPCVFLKG